MSVHYVYITNSRVVSLVSRHGKLVERRELEMTDEGLEQFRTYLAARAKLPVRVFTDLAEEDFRADTIPHVGAGDREVMLATRARNEVRDDAEHPHAHHDRGEQRGVDARHAARDVRGQLGR